MKKQLPTTPELRTAQYYNFSFSKTIKATKIVAFGIAFSIALFVSSGVRAQVSVTATAGTVGPTGYATLKLAFDAINAGTHQGAITISLTGGTTETASAVLNSGAVLPAVYTSVGITATVPVVITGSIVGAIIKLNGADNVTIDGRIGGAGRNITVQNTSTATATAAIWLASVAAGNGCSNDIIRNLELLTGIDPTASGNSTFGIIMCGTTISATANGVDNDNNSFIANRIIKARYGIVTRGTTTDLNINPIVTDNIIGPSAFGTDQIGKTGILMQADIGATVSRNTIQFVGCLVTQTQTGTDRAGIGIGSDGWGATASTTLTSSTYTITKNIIHDIVEEKTFSSVGIYLGTTQSGGATNNLVANNFIYNIRANGTTGDQVCGIGVAGGNGDKIVNNSISMTGDMDPGAATASTTYGNAIRIPGANGTNNANFLIQNNSIYLDASSSSTATMRFYAITLNSSAYVFGTGGLNNNNYYIVPANTQLQTGGLGTNTTAAITTQFASLVNWQAALTVPQDAASIQGDPSYASVTTDLHLIGSSPNLNVGATIAAVTDDIDGQARPNGGAYDIGGDEFYATPGTLQLSSSTYSGNEGAVLAITVNRVGGSSGTVGCTYTLTDGSATGGAACGAGIDYINPGPQLLSFGNAVTSQVINVSLCTDVVIDPSEMFTVTLSLPTGGTSLGSPASATATIVDVPPPFNGTFTVGSGGNYPSLTNPGGIFEALNLGGVSGNVLINIISDLTGETGSISLNEFASPFTVTLKPTGMARAISGTSVGSTALITVNAADRFIIDGSLGSVVNTICPASVASRDLTITNAGASASSAVIWLQSNGANGATNNTVMNCNLIGSGNTQTLFGIGSGSSTISTSSLGSGNNNNSFVNNNISKTQYGIFSQGAGAASKNTGTIINQNLMNTVSPNNIRRAGVLVGFEHMISISGNKISEIASATSNEDVFGICLGNNVISTAAPTGNEVTGATISKNVIGSVRQTATYSACGIFVAPVTTGAGVNEISNNMISGVSANGTGGDFSVGIYAGGGVTSSTNIYYNTVSMSGTQTGGNDKSYALAIGGSNPIVNVQNNILVNTQNNGSGNNFAVGYGYATFTNLTSDHNDYFVTNPGATFFIGATGALNTPTTRLTISDLQLATGKDGFAQNISPVFVSTTDLHLLATSGINTPLNNGAIGVSVIDDIDCDMRMTDIGADEFVPVIGLDMGVTALVAPALTGCYTATETVTVTIKNFGAGTHDFSINPVLVTVNATNAIIYTGTKLVNTGTLASGASMNVDMTTTIDMTGVGTYTFNAFTTITIGTDVSPGNDAMAATNRIVNSKINTFPYVEPFTTAPGWSVVIETAVGSNILWSLGPATGPNGVAGTAAASNFFSGSAGRIERYQSPIMDFTALTKPIMHYYIAHRTYSNQNDGLNIVVSTDCGTTFVDLSPAYLKRYLSTPSLSTLSPSTNAFTPATSGVWRHESIDLSAFAGNPSVIIGFRGLSEFGNILWLDDFIVSDAATVCDDNVASPGTYSCEGSSSIVVNTTGDPAGGTLQMTTYTTPAPNATFAANATATAPNGTIYTPTSVKSTKWFKTTYSGNTLNGYANYDINIDVTGYAPASNVNRMYLLKRADQLSPWVCLPTTAAGNMLTSSGLTTFSDFAVGFQCANPTATVSGGGTACSNQPLPIVSIALTGTSPWSITYTDGMNSFTVNNIMSSPYDIMAATSGTYTVTAISDADCTGTASGSAVVLIKPAPSATITSSNSIYQGSFGNIASVPSAGAGATYMWSLSSGMITSGTGTNMIVYNAGTPPSMTISVTVTSSNGCSASGSNVVNVVVPGPATMIWEPDNITPTACGPATNCCDDILCFNLKYTPGVSGFLTTYTTGFFINCLGATSPIVYNESCVMTDNSFEISQCALIDSVLFNSSGNNGGMAVPIMQNSPIILHRVCLNISTNESVQIREDNITNLTASVDQTGGGHITEYAGYTSQSFSKPGFIVPANVTVTINCPADTIFPVPPLRFDFCGNPVQDSLISRVSVPSSLTCEGTKTYTFRYKDCSGYTQFWSFTYVIEYLDFSIAAGPGGSNVSCPALSDIVPTPPVVVDHCGRTLTPTYTDTGRPACEGFRFYVFTYTDCEGNTHNWVYAYNVEYEPIPNPVDVTQTVNCPLLANVVPTPPVVNDNCGLPLTPISMTSTPALLATTCEGTRTFTWVYQDCENNTQDFIYTYIVERQPFNDPADIGMTVACPVKTDSIPTPPAVVDNCGASLSPTGPVVSPIPACEGTRTYTWTYTDCEGNSANYVFTYTVDRPLFTVPANGGSIVNCPQASNVVPVAPVVIDACGVPLIPIDTMISAPVTCQGVDVTRTYTFHFMDCTGLTLPWVYTYTVRCFPLTLKVFLEGPYDATGDSMKTTLNFLKVLPGQDKGISPSMSIMNNASYTPFGQPYSIAPWNYNGNSGAQYGDATSPGAPMVTIPYPNDVVDWVLVTVRKGGRLPVNNFWTCAGWVHSDGEVTFPDPCGGLVFLPGDSCYVMVQHRTHLGVMSTNAATTTCANYIINWDFTTSNSYQPIFRYGQRLVEPGKWAMHAANGEQITSIAAIGSADLTTWRAFQNAYGYSIGDYNMNGQVESGGDETRWKLNQNRTSGIIFY